MSKNYQLEYQSRGKCEIYRDTGVSKNYKTIFIDYKMILINQKHVSTNLEGYSVLKHRFITLL